MDDSKMPEIVKCSEDFSYVPVKPQDLDPLYYDPDFYLDTAHISHQVRNYLNFNQIRWRNFAEERFFDAEFAVKAQLYCVILVASPLAAKAAIGGLCPSTSEYNMLLNLLSC